MSQPIAYIEHQVDIAPFEIVISSSWRFHVELSEIKGRLGRLGPFVVGTTGDAVVGRHARHREILEYVQHYRISDWRALDDAYLEFPENSAELILCDPRVGVSKKEVRALKSWLLARGSI